MPGPRLLNATPFAAQELFLADEEGRDLLVVVMKATYDLRPGEPLALAEEQAPVELKGSWNGEPGESSPRYDADIAPLKLATDVVLLGHAYPDRRGATWVDAGFQVGPVRKIVRVFGDRWWYRRVGVIAASDPQPFEAIPLIYERAFGGWDRSAPDPAAHEVETRNPVGTGFHGRHGAFVEEGMLPNLELPDAPITGYHDTPPPAGFGFLSGGWAPRVSLAGTYDEAWLRSRMPLLPRDFDRRFFNAAPADQIAPGYLRGDELVRLANLAPEGPLEFRLPAPPPPRCRVTMAEGEALESVPPLDTVVVDMDERRVILVWRAHFPVHRRIYDLRTIEVEPAPVAAVSVAPIPVRAPAVSL